MPRVGGTISGGVELTRATFRFDQRKLDGLRENRVPVLAVEARWQPTYFDETHRFSYVSESQPLTVDLILEETLAERLIEECYRQTGVLTECHDVKLDRIEFSFGYHSNGWDQQTFQIEIHATGHHSKVMWDPSPFVARRDAHPTVCAILRDIFIQHLNMDIGEYPRS